MRKKTKSFLEFQFIRIPRDEEYPREFIVVKCETKKLSYYCYQNLISKTIEVFSVQFNCVFYVSANRKVGRKTAALLVMLSPSLDSQELSSVTAVKLDATQVTSTEQSQYTEPSNRSPIGESVSKTVPSF